MEIAPIPGIRALPSVRAPRGDFRQPEVVDVEGSAKPGDGEREGGGGKASEGEENDLMLKAETESGGTLEEDSARSVDFFA